MTTHSRPRHLLVLATAVLLLTACAGTAATPTPTATPTPAPTATPTPDPTATPTPTPEPVAPAPDELWDATAAEYQGMNGEQVDYLCPAGGTPGSVWGTDVYTDDSSVCTAAVHARAITVEEGGTVTIEIRPGQDEYEASERNGIASRTWGQWGGSFVVVGTAD